MDSADERGKERGHPARILATIDQRLARLVANFEGSGFVRLFTILAGIGGFLVLIGTAWQIWSDYEDRDIDRVNRAWERLLLRAGGNTGKSDALRVLMDKNVRLSALDLSCRSIGGYLDRCTNPSVFDEIVLNDDVADGFDLSEQSIGVLNISGGSAEGWNLSGSRVGKLNVDGARFGAKTADATFDECRIVNTRIVDEIFGASSLECELTGSEIYIRMYESGSVDIRPIEHAWAWADSPPRLFTYFAERGVETAKSFPFLASEEYQGDYTVTLCAPPLDSAGNPTPFDQRPTGHAAWEACEPILKEVAASRYPEAYRGIP